MPKLNKQQNNKLAVESGDNVQGPKEENLGLKSFTKNNINDIFRIEEMKSGLNDLSIQQETREVHLDAHKTSSQNLDQKPNRDQMSSSVVKMLNNTGPMAASLYDPTKRYLNSRGSLITQADKLLNDRNEIS